MDPKKRRLFKNYTTTKRRLRESSFQDVIEDKNSLEEGGGGDEELKDVDQKVAASSFDKRHCSRDLVFS